MINIDHSRVYLHNISVSCNKTLVSLHFSYDYTEFEAQPRGILLILLQYFKLQTKCSLNTVE